jgi:hypothetical protein
MSRAVSSISNILLSIEKLLWDNIAEPNGELLICKNDYLARLDELTEAGSALLWNVENIELTHHWSAELQFGVTTFQDFGNRKLYRLTDEIKFLLDENLYIPVYDYLQPDVEGYEVNKLVVTGPMKWLPIFTEPNEFKTSMFLTKVKYAQTSYR